MATSIIPPNELVTLCKIANHRTFYHFGHRSTCILTSAALLHVLTELKYNAQPMRVRASVGSDDPKLTGVLLGSDGDGTRRPKAQPGHWHGHLAVVADDSILIDATIDQTQEAHDWIQMGPIVCPVTPEWLAGTDRIRVTSGNVNVSYFAFPGRGGFKSAPDWRRSHWYWLARDILNVYELMK